VGSKYGELLLKSIFATAHERGVRSLYVEVLVKHEALLELLERCSRVHCDSLNEGGARLCPCGIATATTQHFTVASLQGLRAPPRSSCSVMREQDAPHPAQIHQVRAGR